VAAETEIENAAFTENGFALNSFPDKVVENDFLFA